MVSCEIERIYHKTTYCGLLCAWVCMRQYMASLCVCVEPKNKQQSFLYKEHHRAKDGGERRRAAARIAQLRALHVEEAARELRNDDDLDVKERVKTVLDQMRGEGGAGGAQPTGGRRPGPRSVGGPGGVDGEQRGEVRAPAGGTAQEMAALMDVLVAASPSPIHSTASPAYSPASPTFQYDSQEEQPS